MARHGGLKLAAATPLAAHACLLAFTCLLVKEEEEGEGEGDKPVPACQVAIPQFWPAMPVCITHVHRWIFLPVYAFHAVVARCKCSMPAPNTPHDRQWAPCHTLVMTPLLLAFEVLLCCYLVATEGGEKPPVNLVVVSFPLLLLQAIVLADNFRMCMVLMPGEDDNMTDEALWETLPHFAVAVSMVFFMAASIFSVLKLSGQPCCPVDLIGEFFAFLLCMKWTNPHAPVAARLNSQSPLPVLAAQGAGGGQLAPSAPSPAPTASTPLLSSVLGPGAGPPNSQLGESGDSQNSARSPRSDVGSDSSAADSEEEMSEFACGLPEIGGHLIKAGVVVFQVLLCMHLEGQPGWAKKMPMGVLFCPLLVVQVAALMSAAVQLAECALLAYSADMGARLAAATKEHDPCSFLTRGMRYSTFEATPPEHIRQMRKGELTEEVVRLQAALEKVLCRVCFERDISLVLMPCRHRVLCTVCAEKCKVCPICRCAIVDRMAVFDV
eukprot:jgi/Mesen1/1890/ME000143S00939